VSEAAPHDHGPETQSANMNIPNFLPISLLAIVAAAIVDAPAHADAPIKNDRTKTVLTIQRVVEGNGSKVVAATLQVQVEFDRDFFCSANIDGDSMSAHGIVHKGSNQFFRAELEYSDHKNASNSAVKVNFLTKPGEHHTLTGLNDPRGSEMIEAFITEEHPSR